MGRDVTHIFRIDTIQPNPVTRLELHLPQSALSKWAAAIANVLESDPPSVDRAVFFDNLPGLDRVHHLVKRRTPDNTIEYLIDGVPVQESSLRGVRYQLFQKAVRR